MKNKFKRAQLTIRKNHRRGAVFGVAFALTLLALSLLIPKLNIHADPVDDPVFNITYDFNGGLKDGEGTYATQSVGVGMVFSYENLVTDFGVTVPENQVLNYITVNDEPFNVGDGLYLHEDIAIKYYWRDYTETMYTIDFDANGATLIDYDVPPAIPAGQAYIMNAPDSWQVTPPENMIFDAFEVNGERLESGTLYFVNQNISFKLLWKDRPEFNPEDYALIEIGGGATAITEADGDDNAVTVTFANGTLTVSGAGLYSDTTMTDHNTYQIYALGDITIAASPNEHYYADLVEGGERLGTSTKNYNVSAGDMVRVDAEFNEEGPQGDPEPDYGDITFNLTWTNTFVNIWINDHSVIEESQDFVATEFVYNDVVVASAGYTDPASSNVIRLQNRFGDYEVSEFTINGTVYNEENEHVVINDQGWFITVPGSPTYTISGNGNPDSVVPRTIIWANVDADTTAEEYDEDMRLEHGKAKVIAIYDGETQVEGEVDVDEATGMGWVQVVPGHHVVFEFVPEYGYQLTSVRANGVALEPQDTMNQYTFVMPDTNVHFAATFEQTDDVVATNSEKVTSGSIVLGGGLDGGSAKLTVNDIELSADKIAGFENAAGDYTITNYLDIDLYNIFYKANSDDEEDVWSNKLDELDEEATITIQLAEGIDANDIVIVHNIHDGEEYEIIPIESYDPATNTITFKTRSFSNYAIAERDSTESPDSDSESSTPTDSTNQPTVPNTGASTTGNGAAALTISGILISIIAISSFVLVAKLQ